MKKHLLNKNQLFSLKRKTLEKRIRKYYFETGDAKDTRLLRRLSIFFEDYFDKKEWKVLSRRLFTVKHFIADKLEKLYTHFAKMPLESLVGS